MKTQSTNYNAAAVGKREIGSAGFQPAVSRISNPQALRITNDLPTESRRYSRLKVCATASGVCSFAAVSLLLGALSAPALQALPPGANPGSTTTAPANARLGQPTLTPAAPVTSKVPASSEEDIRDIRQPRHLPTPIPWAAAAAGVIILSAAAFAAWRWIRRGNFLEMSPCEIALQQLEEVRQLMDPDHAREYCFAASQIIRSYIEAQFHMRAPRLTTEEFLRDLVEVRETMLASHRALLGNFLEHCDLAKFAGWRYSMPALEDMHQAAMDFVRQAAVNTTAPDGNGVRPASQPEPVQTTAA